jgi:hypothetical protein
MISSSTKIEFWELKISKSLKKDWISRAPLNRQRLKSASFDPADSNPFGILAVDG